MRAVTAVARWAALLALLTAFGAAAVIQLAPAAQSASPPPACRPGDPSCVVVVVGAPGGPGSGGGGQGGGSQGGGPSKPDPCAKYPGPLHTICQGNTGVGCLSLYDEEVGKVSFDALNIFLAANQCPQIPAAAAPPPSPATLAERAAASFKLPDPSGHRSPGESIDFHGHSFTYVNLFTFYWSDPVAWANCGGTCTATASAGGNSATVTAKPVSLTFDPGNGDAPVSCAGPGRPWLESDGNDPPSQGACAYQYLKVTGGPGYDNPITSTQTITWQLTWTGTGNTSGTLTQRTTSTSGQLNVFQIQTVTCDPHTPGSCH